MARSQKQILELIPIYQSGIHKGHPTNDVLRDLHAKLSKYSYGPHELAMLEAEVLAAIPKRTLDKRAREAEES